MMSPDEALAFLSELAEDLELGWVDIYGDDADVDVENALKVAVECLKEKCHE